jgi:acetyl esterase/lipase
MESMPSATFARRAVCGFIRRLGSPHLAVSALAAALLFCVAAPASASSPGLGPSKAVWPLGPPPELGVAEEVPPGPPPQLLLFHGGSFIVEDPVFEPEVAERASAAGFEPHFVNYPLGDMPAAVIAARAEARSLREEFGVERVFAYGSSAGGTLAALLAGEGLVAAAVAKAPPTDLVTWEWPLNVYGPNYFEEIGVSEEARYRLSPLRRPERNPLLVYQGVSDQVVPLAMNETFAEKFANVELWPVPGGHFTDQIRPWLISRAMHWLALIAARQPGE